MTRSTAIICETNPCHRGHKYLFDQVKGLDATFLQDENKKIPSETEKTTTITIAIMSGNFVQRGLPAVLDKYTRAGMLLDVGVDLVVELPFPWSVAGGEAFAAGGVAVASGLGTDRLAFGSESGEGAMLTDCAAWLDTPAARERMLAMEEAEPGLGAAVLHERLCQEGGFLLKPNDKLAVWYLRQLTAQKSSVEPYPIRRLPHDDQVISATKIREKLVGGEDITPHVPSVLTVGYENATFTTPERFYDLAFAWFRLYHDLPLPADKTGLLARLTDVAYRSSTGAAFMEKAATKKYTHARIRRSILLAMTNCPTPDTIGLPRYTVLLAANEKGRAYLAERRKISVFPVLTKPAQGKDLPADVREQFDWLTRADSLYGMCMEPAREGDWFLKKHPVIR